MLMSLDLSGELYTDDDNEFEDITDNLDPYFWMAGVMAVYFIRKLII